MNSLTLEQHNRAELASQWREDGWLVACLCAAWCDVCNAYRAGFEQLATRLPGTRLVWIDIEDHADLVGDFEVENFPTLLIQRGDAVAFYGTVLPDPRLTERLVLAQQDKSDMEFDAKLAEFNLRQRLCGQTG